MPGADDGDDTLTFGLTDLLREVGVSLVDQDLFQGRHLARQILNQLGQDVALSQLA